MCSVSHNRESYKTAEPIKMPFGVWTWGPKNYVFGGARIPHPPGKWAFLVGEKHWEYLTCNSYSHPYSEGGSSDVAFCSHYCSYLFSVLLDMLIVSVSNLQMRQSRCIRNVCRNLLVSDTNFSNFWSRYTVQHGMNQNWFKILVNINSHTCFSHVK